jgi:hypothetical protein
VGSVSDNEVASPNKNVFCSKMQLGSIIFEDYLTVDLNLVIHRTFLQIEEEVLARLYNYVFSLFGKLASLPR